MTREQATEQAIVTILEGGKKALQELVAQHKGEVAQYLESGGCTVLYQLKDRTPENIHYMAQEAEGKPGLYNFRALD